MHALTLYYWLRTARVCTPANVCVRVCSHSVNMVKIEGFFRFRRARFPSSSHRARHRNFIRPCAALSYPGKDRKKKKIAGPPADRSNYCTPSLRRSSKLNTARVMNVIAVSKRHTCTPCSASQIRSNPFSCAHLSEMIPLPPLKLGGGGPGRASMQGVVHMCFGQRRGEGVRRAKNLIPALKSLVVHTEVKTPI